jgi:hypothetical protein
MESIVTFVSENPGWTCLIIILVFSGISEVCEAIFGKKDK